MRRGLRNGVVTVLLAAAVLLAVVAATHMEEWTNPFGAPYRAAGTPVPIGGPFTLTGPDGKPVSSTDFHGKWMLVYFGYTNCPDACPTALNDIGVALGMMKQRSGSVAPVFITVDPERDTPAVLSAYTHQFSPRIVGLTRTTRRDRPRRARVPRLRRPSSDAWRRLRDGPQQTSSTSWIRAAISPASSTAAPTRKTSPPRSKNSRPDATARITTCRA